MASNDYVSSIDGFITPRRRPIDDRRARAASFTNLDSSAAIHDRDVHIGQPLSAPASRQETIDELAKLSLDENTILDSLGREEKKNQNRLSKRYVKWLILGVLLLLLISGGLFAWKALSTGGKVFKGNIFNALSSLVSPDKPLKTDGHGNTNVLLLGTSESDPHHPGAQLTDAMMVMSINKNAHTAFLLSIPRDLWVKGDGACSAGYQYKINAVYECHLSNSLGGLSSTQNDEATAETQTAAKVGSVVGIDINYVVHMNLAVIQQVVDAVGGVTININSPDPRGILDRNFDWRCKYKCYLVKYPNGPATLTGTNAMWLAQARNDSGGYGLPRGNFDREANQRKILIATRDKATSIGFLANPLNSIKLLDSIGNNIHTTIDASEIKSFVDIAKDIPSKNIVSIDIIENSPGVLTTGTGPDGSSIVRPVKGLTDYTDVHTLTDALLAGYAPVVAEGASIDFVNASGISGAAKDEASNLSSKGYTVSKVQSAPNTYRNTDRYTLIDLSKDAKPATLARLKNDLGISKTLTSLPDGIMSTAPFVIVLGNSSSATPIPSH